MIISNISEVMMLIVIKFNLEPSGTEGTKMFTWFRSHDLHSGHASR